MNSSSSTLFSSSSKYFTKKSFTILSDEDDESMPDQINESYLPAIINTKVKSVYHQHCTVPNKDFSILRDAIGSKLQTTVTVQHLPISNHNTTSASAASSYPSTEFFNRVSTKLRSLRVPLAEDSETETDGDSKNRKRVMEKPMFITTVRSGTFLEPPPEVAALLGLRKNYTTTLTSTTSSSEKSGNEHSMMYSFASRPRVVKARYQTNTPPRNSFMRNETRREKRDVEDDSAKTTKDEGSTFYGNTMYDRRVARGSNFASLRPNASSIEHVQSRQAEARRRAAVRQRAQIRARRLRMGTPPPVDGRKHEQMQTEKYWEDITEKPPEKSIACQADLPTDSTSRSNFSFANTVANGEDAETQIDPGDLPTCDDQIHMVVTYIVNKILREAILEINEEIENFQSYSYNKKMKKQGEITFKDNFTDAGAIIVTKEELLGLIEAAIQYLKSLEKLDGASLEYIEKIKNEKLLEITIQEIRTVVRDIKFISEIIQRQAQSFPLDECEEPNSTLERETTIEEVAEHGSHNLEEVVPTAINQVEASNVVRNLDFQETEAVIADTDKTDFSSVVQTPGDRLEQDGAKNKEDTTIEDGDEKTEVGITDKFTNNELEVTKNKIFEKETSMASKIENTDEHILSNKSEELRESRLQVEEEVQSQSEYKVDDIEFENQTLIAEKENYLSDEDQKITIVKLDSESQQESNEISDQSIAQATNAESQEIEFNKKVNTVQRQNNIEDSMNKSDQISENAVIGSEIIDLDNKSNFDSEKQRQKRSESKEDTQVLLKDTTSKTSMPNNLADKVDEEDLHNQKSIEDNQSLETEDSTKLEDKTQSDDVTFLNDVSTEKGVKALKNISSNQLEKENEDIVDEENSTSPIKDKTPINDANIPAEIYKENDPAKEVTLPENEINKEENLGANSDHVEKEEILPIEKTDNEDSPSVNKIENEIISPMEASNEPSSDQIQLNKTSNVDQSIEKISKAKSLETNSINIIESTDIRVSRRRSSLPNSNYESTTNTEEIIIDKNEDKKNMTEITTPLQSKESNDPGTLDHIQTEEQSTNNPMRAEETDSSAVAVEDQIINEEDVIKNSTTGEEESPETTELLNQKISSSIQSVELEPTSTSSTVDTIQSSTFEKSSHVSKTEMKSSKLLKHEETVSNEMVKKDNLEDAQSLDSKEATPATTIEEETSKDLDLRVIKQEMLVDTKSDNEFSHENLIAEALPNIETKLDEPITSNIETLPGQNNDEEGETKQQSINVDLDNDEDLDNMEIEGTRIVEETFTETTKTYKEISIRETTLVEREFFEYTTADDDLDSSNSNLSSKKSSRESTASNSTKQEIFINIERPLSDQNDLRKTSKLSTDGKGNTDNIQNHNGKILMRES